MSKTVKEIRDIERDINNKIILNGFVYLHDIYKALELYPFEQDENVKVVVMSADVFEDIDTLDLCCLVIDDSGTRAPFRKVFSYAFNKKKKRSTYENGINTFKRNPEPVWDYWFTKDGEEHDPVNHPSHYTRGGIEVHDFIKSWHMDFDRGNVIKYVTRAPFKSNELEDLKKAQWYLNELIEQAEEKQKEED